MALHLQATITTFLFSAAARLHSDERGQDTLEWAMLGGLVALGILAVGALFTTALQSMVTGIGKCVDFNNATVCAPGF